MADENLDWSRYKFAGWIPTTTGHLSFSSIGVDRTCQDVFAWNRRLAEKPVASPGTPDIFAFQWRHNPEFGWFRRIVNSLFTRFMSIQATAPRDEYDLSLRELIAPPHTSQYYLFEGYNRPSPTPFIGRNASYQNGEEVGIRIDKIGETHGAVWIIVKNPFADGNVWDKFEQHLSYIARLNSDFRTQNEFKTVWNDLSKLLNSGSPVFG